MRLIVVCLLAAAMASAGCDSSGRPSSPASPTVASAGGASGTGCSRTSVGFTALTDLGTRTYNGQQGGLYPGGMNVRPAFHEMAGLERARSIVPMDRDGRPDPNGRYVMVSIGMSNTTMEFSAFRTLANADPSRDPHLVIVDGAQGGQTAQLWSSGGCPCWTTLNDRLTAAGVTARQVTVAWIKQADASPTSGWPTYARALKDELAAMLSMMAVRFPNLRLVYLSSRVYGGYALSGLNPEPYAYESGIAVKWLIEDQLRGQGGLAYDIGDSTGGVPWIAWGPYLWADGLAARSDGLTWSCGDFSASDGTHPSTLGQRKVADMLLNFVRTDSTAKAWYLTR